MPPRPQASAIKCVRPEARRDLLAQVPDTPPLPGDEKMTRHVARNGWKNGTRSQPQFRPAGTPENSPPFQWWEGAATKPPKPRRGERMGPRWLLANGDRVLSSLRDWPTRAALGQRMRCARSKAPASRAHSKRCRARRNAPPARSVWSAAKLCSRFQCVPPCRQASATKGIRPEDRRDFLAQVPCDQK